MKKNRAFITILATIWLHGAVCAAASATLPGDTLRFGKITALPDSFPDLTDFTVDQLGNIYVLSENEVVVKYDAWGKKRARFSQDRLGNAAGIFAGNALKLMVWYADFRTVLFLDRSLTQLGGPLNLINAGFPEARTIGLSADGNFWLYDEVAFKLKKISTAGDLLLESQRLNAELDGRLNVQQIMDDGVHVVAADSTLGFFIFDVFGQFQRQIGIDSTGITQFFLENDMLRWLDRQQQLHVVSLNSPAPPTTWFFPQEMANAAKLKLVPGGVVMGRKEGKIVVYRG